MPGHIPSNRFSNQKIALNQYSSSSKAPKNINQTTSPAHRISRYGASINSTSPHNRLQSSSNPIEGLFTQFSPYQNIKNIGRVTEIKPGLVTGQIQSDSNKTLFFAREELTDDRLEHWLDFIDINKNAAGNINHALIDKFELNAYQFGSGYYIEDDTLDDQAFYQTLSESNVLNLISKPLNISVDSAENLARHLYQSKSGYQVFNPNSSSNSEKRYALYISTKPITDFAFDHIDRGSEEFDNTQMNISTYAKDFSHIAMAVSSGIRDKCVEHRGIFKTTASILNKHKEFKTLPDQRKLPLSMMLQFFGMQAGVKYNNAKYFFVAPAVTMGEIFEHNMKPAIDSKAVIIGLDNIKSARLQHLIREHDEQGVECGFEKPFLCHLSRIKNPIFS
ncbi:MAG: hypothetical protein VX185_05595 [Pseudomonadota bacterium]|nr:hypothetical protein [Pseudomonadota bacterium]